MINQPNLDGDTPLHIAARQGTDTAVIAEMLLQGGADPFIENNIGERPLDLLLEKFLPGFRVSRCGETKWVLGHGRRNAVAVIALCMDGFSTLLLDVELEPYHALETTPYLQKLADKLQELFSVPLTS